MTKHTGWLPVGSLLLGATLWGIVWYPMRLLEQQGVTGLWLTLGIYLVPLFVMLPFAWPHRHWCLRQPWVLTGIAAAAWWTNTAFILAVLQGNVMRVLLLFYLAPVWSVLLGRWWLKERLTPVALAVVAVALCGGVLMLWRGAASLMQPVSVADLLAITAGMAFAVHNVCIRKGDTIPVVFKSYGAWAGVVIGSLLAIAVAGKPMPVVGYGVLLGVAALGLFGMLGMTLLVQYGVTHMTVQRSAVILLFELVAGAVSQQLLTDEVMGPLEWLGGGLIVLAAFIASRMPDTASQAD